MKLWRWNSIFYYCGCFLFRALIETPFALIHISLFPVNARQSHMISLDIYWHLKDSIGKEWQLQSQINESPNNRITQRDAAKGPPPPLLLLWKDCKMTRYKSTRGFNIAAGFVWLRIPWPDDAVTIWAKGSIENRLVWMAMASYPGSWWRIYFGTNRQATVTTATWNCLLA